MSQNQRNSGPWVPALSGGVIGSALTAAVLVLAGPSLFGERLVREALVANPQMLVQAGDALREQQYASTLAPIRASLERPFYSSWKGAGKPEVTMTYFFDYACGYCRQSNPDIERLLKEEKGLRVVYRELPILGPESVAAARISLAASRRGSSGLIMTRSTQPAGRVRIQLHLQPAPPEYRLSRRTIRPRKRSSGPTWP